MLYLGTLDDKSTEYPYGGASNKASTGHKAILHRLLFCNERLLVEEGFVLASEEAVKPEKVTPIFLPAIRAGLIKVASRHGDMRSYAKERRSKKHASPPLTAKGRQFLSDLQSACDASSAFIQYPPDQIDELTFNRLRGAATMDIAKETLSAANLKMPDGFLQQYEYRYAKGNNGRQWTARAAWEDATKLSFSAESNALHALMAIANRERQLIRAAAISKVNRIELMIETGFEKDPHDLAIPVTLEAARRQGSSHEGIFPKICSRMLMRNLDRLLIELAQKDSSLNLQRSAFLTLLNSPSTIDVGALQRAAKRYEDEIYAVAGETQPEKLDAVHLAGSLFVGTVLSARVNALIGALEGGKAESRALFNERLQHRLGLNLKRRAFFRRVLAGALVTGVTYAGMKMEDALADNVVRSSREHWEDHVLDDYASHFDPTRRSHQILKVDRAGAARLKL